MVIVVKLILLITCIASKFVVALLLQDDACSVISSRCGGIDIRFPFHLTENKDKQLQRNNCCVFPSGFELSCAYGHPIVKFDYEINTSVPGLHLSLNVEAYVDSIDYKSQKLNFTTFYDSKKPNIKQHYDHYYFSNSPFKPFTVKESDPYDTPYLQDYTFYKCSSTISSYTYRLSYVLKHVPSLSDDSFQVYAVNSHLKTAEAPLESCTKLYNISNVPLFRGGLSWSKPYCGYCEDKRQYCKFKPNSTTLTQCFPIPKGPSSNKRQVTGRVGEIFGATLIFVALFYGIYSYKLKKDYQHKIETFLEDYKALKPTRYSYADIKKITNHFKVELGEGGFGSVFKGQLSNDVAVAVKVLNDKVDVKGSGEDFINEVSTIGLVHHVNVVRLVGYCADGCRRALVYEFLPNNSLEKFVYSKKNHQNGFLGWQKMQEISLGIAKGIEYLHQGCTQRILHFDIKPNNILLDQNFNPKISDFGLAKLCTKGQSIVSMTMARGTIGYIAPEVFSRNFGKVSSKSDVYSFGMLLLEMVGAKNHQSEGTEGTGEVYFPEWIFNQLEQERETGSRIEEDSNRKIERKLTIVGLWCINWHPADRPSMKNVIRMLQGEECPPMPPNPFSSTSSRNAFGAAPSRVFSSGLEAISESE